MKLLLEKSDMYMKWNVKTLFFVNSITKLFNCMMGNCTALGKNIPRTWILILIHEA